MKLKINQGSGWIQQISFKEDLDRMITRYIINQDCVDRVKSGE